MRFCSACGARVVRKIPPGEDRERHVCTACDAIHYQNPKAVVGCIVEVGERVLLCRRAIQPAYDRWTFPAGFQELGETAEEGARRETLEEANAEVDVLAPFAVLDIPHISQTYVIFRARLTGTFSAGAETLEVRAFGLDELPFGQFAFPTIRFALELYRADRHLGLTRVHFAAVRWDHAGDRYRFESYQLADHRTVPPLDPVAGPFPGRS